MADRQRAKAAPLPESDAGSRAVRALTVAAVARRLGVAPSTLRTWDRRYGLGPRGHSSGAHRRYTTEDLERLLIMRRLTLEGVPPAEAARIAGEHSGGDEVLAAWAVGSADGGGDLAIRGLPGEVAVDVTAAVRGLFRAASSLDFLEMARLLRAGLGTRGIEDTWQSLALPVLARIGERWEATGEGVEMEHALSQVLTSVLHAERPVPLHPLNTSPVLLGCAEGEQHTLALSVLDYALAERGVLCRVLGAGMPRQALVDAARRSGPAAIFLFAQLPTRDELLLAELPRQRPSPRLIVGGPGWAACELPPRVRHVNSLRESVTEIVDAVRF